MGWVSIKSPTFFTSPHSSELKLDHPINRRRKTPFLRSYIAFHSEPCFSLSLKIFSFHLTTIPIPLTQTYQFTKNIPTSYPFPKLVSGNVFMPSSIIHASMHWFNTPICPSQHNEAISRVPGKERNWRSSLELSRLRRMGFLVKMESMESRILHAKTLLGWVGYSRPT